MKSIFSLTVFIFITASSLFAQNSLVGDGFGGRSWYKPYNYAVGSYSGYTVCGEENQLYGWGSNGRGQLGNSSINGYAINPVKVINMVNVIYYSSGYIMGGIKADNSGWIWGQGHTLPTEVIQNVFFVDAGINSCAFIKNDGTVWSVGRNRYGEFGAGNCTSIGAGNRPVQMIGITNAVRTAQGRYTTCVLLEDGTVYSAGIGPALGDGVGDTSYLPTQVIGLKDIVDIKASTYTNYALDKNGNVWSWGTGDLGQGNIGSLDTAKKIDALKNIIALSASSDGYHCLALDEDRICYGWGSDSQGGLGNGSSNNIPSPIIVANNIVDIMAGEFFSYLIKADGSLWASGNGAVYFSSSFFSSDKFIELDLSTLGIDICLPAEHGTAVEIINRDSTHISSDEVLFFPNAFSPNGDGKNDIFRAVQKPNALLETYRMEIYNRWGQLVFESEDVNIGWDGSFLGEVQPIESYYYRVKFNTPNRKPLQIKGDVTLLH